MDWTRLGGAWPSRMVVHIRVAKTGKNQTAEVQDEAVARLVRTWAQERKEPEALLFPGGIAAYRKAFNAACQSLGLGDTYVVHSLRHGGATRAYMDHMKIEDVMVRGRWLSNRNARRYIQMSKALLLTSTAPVRTMELGMALAADVVTSFTTALVLSNGGTRW
jgi:integrase